MKPFHGVQRILVIRTDRLGDLLLNIPAVRALRQSYANAYLAMLVQPHLREVVDTNPDVDEVIEYDKNGSERSWGATLAMAWQLRLKRFDMVVILNPSKRSNILAWLSGARYRVGYDRKWGALLTQRIPDRKYLGDRHEVEYNMELVRRAGAQTEDLSVRLNPAHSDRRSVRETLEAFGWNPEEKIVLVHPGTSSFSKRWPAERYAAVVRQLCETEGLRVVLVGGGDEFDAIAELHAQCPDEVFNLTGRFGIRQLAALCELAVCLVSNDSGPVHVAAAVGTRTVVIFGRTRPGLSPRRWGPWGRGHVVFQHDVGCAVCVPEQCDLGYQCLEAVSAEEIAEEVRSLISPKELLHS
ncbi:MAG: glycosyltransferase family 9 protein [Candidatus Omnitrophica bacterium]|nr:glycosyltransferase family 9 protein [Candidatus Omnitrophota bacterium]